MDRTQGAFYRVVRRELDPDGIPKALLRGLHRAAPVLHLVYDHDLRQRTNGKHPDRYRRPRPDSHLAANFAYHRDSSDFPRNGPLRRRQGGARRRAKKGDIRLRSDPAQLRIGSAGRSKRRAALLLPFRLAERGDRTPQRLRNGTGEPIRRAGRRGRESGRARRNAGSKALSCPSTCRPIRFSIRRWTTRST